MCVNSINNYHFKRLFDMKKIILLIFIISFILTGCPSGRKKSGPSTGGYGSSKSHNY
jgi:hypothetical protein